MASYNERLHLDASNKYEIPNQHIESEGEKLIKKLVQKQLYSNIHLETQLQQTKEFAVPADLISITSFVAGQNDLGTFKKYSDHVNNLEELNSYGLTDSEIELLLDYEKGEYIYTKHRNICKTVLEEDINRILAKVSDAKSKKSAPVYANDSVSRHVKEIALCVKPNSAETKLYNFALSCSSVEKPSVKPSDHPVNQLQQLERDHFGYLSSGETVPPLKKRRKKAKKYLDNPDDAIELAVATSSVSNGNTNSKWDLKHVPIENKPKPSEKKNYTCNNKVYYTIRNNEIVKLNSSHVDATQKEENINVQNVIEKKLTEEEIRNIPRFQNYEKGALSKVLYIKNLANGVKEEDLKRLIDFLCNDDCKTATYRLLNGKMKGQAFITFDTEYCEQRWTILRNRFCTEKRKCIPSGSGSDAGKQTWPFFKAMSFIDEFIVPRRTYRNLKIVQRGKERVSCYAEDEPRTSCSTAVEQPGTVEDPLSFGAPSTTSLPCVVKTEEETAVEHSNPDLSHTPTSTPNSEVSVQKNMFENAELTVEETEHEAETSVLRSRSNDDRKNHALKLADSIQAAFGMLNKYLEKLSESNEENESFANTVVCGMQKIKSAKKRYLAKAQIMQIIAENISDDEL